MLTMFCGIVRNTVVQRIYNNKENPLLKCEGKCYLAKIQKEQKEQNAQHTLKELQSEIIYFTPSAALQAIFKPISGISRQEPLMAYYLNLYDFDFAAQRVKPPQQKV
jgi:hypothetical protein